MNRALDLFTLIFMFSSSIMMSAESYAHNERRPCEGAMGDNGVQTLSRPPKNATALDSKIILDIIAWRRNEVPLYQQREFLNAALSAKGFSSSSISFNVDVILSYSNLDLMRVYSGRHLSLTERNEQLVREAEIDLAPFLSAKGEASLTQLRRILSSLNNEGLTHLLDALADLYSTGTLDSFQRSKVIMLAGAVLAIRPKISDYDMLWTHIQQSLYILEMVLTEKVWRHADEQMLASQGLIWLSFVTRQLPVEKRNIFAARIKVMTADFSKEFKDKINALSYEEIMGHLSIADFSAETDPKSLEARAARGVYGANAALRAYFFHIALLNRWGGAARNSDREHWNDEQSRVHDRFYRPIARIAQQAMMVSVRSGRFDNFDNFNFEVNSATPE